MASCLKVTVLFDLHELNFAEHLEAVQGDGVEFMKRNHVLGVLVIHVYFAPHFVGRDTVGLLATEHSSLTCFRIDNCYHPQFLRLLAVLD